MGKKRHNTYHRRQYKIPAPKYKQARQRASNPNISRHMAAACQPLFQKDHDKQRRHEFRLMQALKVSGFLTSLVGPSKMGKTILCEKVVGFRPVRQRYHNRFKPPADRWRLQK